MYIVAVNNIYSVYLHNYCCVEVVGTHYICAVLQKCSSYADDPRLGLQILVVGISARVSGISAHYCLPMSSLCCHCYNMGRKSARCLI